MALDGTVHVQDAQALDRTICGTLLVDTGGIFMKAVNYAKYWHRQWNPKFCEVCKERADERD